MNASPGTALHDCSSGDRRTIWRAGLLALMFLLGCFDMSNGDIWWHLRTGQLIWQRGEIPQTDWYTYTNPDAEWIDLHWGFQLASAWLWSIGGAAGLVLAKSVLGAGTLGVCLTIERRGWPVWQTAACWLVPVLIFAGRYYVRPEMISLFLLAVTLAILHRADRHPRLLWGLPLVQLVWVNVQGLFVLQFVVLACYLADSLAERWLGALSRRKREGKPSPGAVLGVAAACAAASLANPYGLRGALFPLTLWRRLEGPDREFYQQFSNEFFGMSEFLARYGLAGLLSNMSAFLLVLLALLCVATFALLAARRLLRLYPLLLFLAFGCLAWRMTRNSVLLAVVGGVVFRTNLGELLESADSESRGCGAGDTGRPQESRSVNQFAARLTGVCLVLLILSIVTGLYPLLRPARTSRRLGLGQAGWYDHAAAMFLSGEGFPRRIYAAHEGMAALCIYHLGPQHRVFADGRLEVNTRETLQRYLAIRRELAEADPAAMANLVRDIPPGPDGRRAAPALIFDNRTLIFRSVGRPGLLQGILRSGRWRCVYSSVRIPTSPGDPTALLDGATIFVTGDCAERLRLPGVDVSPLLVTISSLRAARGGQAFGSPATRSMTYLAAFPEPPPCRFPKAPRNEDRSAHLAGSPAAGASRFTDR